MPGAARTRGTGFFFFDSVISLSSSTGADTLSSHSPPPPRPSPPPGKRAHSLRPLCVFAPFSPPLFPVRPPRHHFGPESELEVKRPPFADPFVARTHTFYAVIPLSGFRESCLLGPHFLACSARSPRLSGSPSAHRPTKTLIPVTGKHCGTGVWSWRPALFGEVDILSLWQRQRASLVDLRTSCF